MDPHPQHLQSSPHFLIVSLPAQSHLNPALQLALRLLHSNLAGLVTLATTVSASARITTNISPTTSYPSGLRFATFSDGHDDPSGYKGRALGRDGESYMSSLRHRGSETLSDLISRTHSPKFDCVIYTILNSFAADVSRRHGLPSAVLWVQPAAMLQLYHCYFTGHADAIHNAFHSSSSSSTDPSANEPRRSSALELPGLPPLSSDEIPALFSPSNPAHSSALAIFREIFDELSRQPADNRTVLVNTFEELESEPLKALRVAGKFQVLPIGPLLPVFGHTNNQLDLFKRSEEEDYVSWLDSKPDSSVVYVSFGSISVLSGRMLRELARTLIEINRPFLWVIKPKDHDTVGEEEAEIMKWLKGHRELRTGKENGMGMVVPWCNQVKVLSHRAVGCFVSHCGWNSSLESLGYGVPVVALPHWVDQLTNAKLLEGVWKVGVRAARGGDEENDDGDEKVASVVVDSWEISRCVEKVMESDEIRRNASRWKELACQAVGEGGSSDANLREFVEHVASCPKRVEI